MKFRHLISAFALAAIPATMMGVPAYPGKIIQTNPDGSTVEIRLHGDEYFSYMTDVDGNLLERNARGFLTPMTRQGITLKATADNIQMLRAEKLAANPQEASTLGGPQGMAALDSDGRSTFPTTSGNVKSAVILLEYSDVKFSKEDPVKEFDNWLNQKGYSENDAHGSVRDYYLACSENQFDPQFDILGVVTLPETSAYYVGNDKYDNFKEALRYAVNYLDDSVDFSQYDFDSDGVIDTIYFIYAGYGQADTGDTTTIWPHQSSMVYSNITLDGVKFGPYATSNELKGGAHYYNQDGMLCGIGTFCHEFGHVIGLPDLYDPNYNANAITPGEWSVMDQGSYNDEGTCPPLFSAYEKWSCNWIEYEEPVAGESYELLSADQKSRGIRLSVTRPNGGIYKNEYFVLESRSRTGWDEFLPDEGLLIWHIDYKASAWNSNTVNSTTNHPRVFLVTVDGTCNPFLDGTGSPTYAAWPGQEVKKPKTYIYPAMDISFDLYYSVYNELDVYLTNIAYDTEKRASTFDYNKITAQPDDMVVMHEAVRFEADNISRNVRLEWDAVEDADSYALTVWRVNSAGKTFYLQNCNELNVGKATSYEFKSLSETLMKQTYYAYVRVIKGIPSSQTSNEITFTPSEMTVDTAVEGIYTDEAPVFGINGAIIAPADAEIFNLSGVKVKNDNLPAGIYIVRTNGKTTKVIVK